jgi:hypothetical protein
MAKHFTCDVGDCHRPFNTRWGLRVHQWRSHKTKSKTASKTASKLRGEGQQNRRRAGKAVLVQVNYCSSCGNRLPNAIIG